MAHDRPGNRMVQRLFGGGGQRQHFVSCVVGGECVDFDHIGAPLGQRGRLVEHIVSTWVSISSARPLRIKMPWRAA